MRHVGPGAIFCIPKDSSASSFVWYAYVPVSATLGRNIYASIDYKHAHGGHPSILPDVQVAKLHKSIDRLLVHYSYLRDVVTKCDEPKLLCNVAPKFHHLYHLGQAALHCNPRLAWTYSNEDWMSLVKRLGEAYRHGIALCHRSLPMMRAWASGEAFLCGGHPESNLRR